MACICEIKMATMIKMNKKCRFRISILSIWWELSQFFCLKNMTDIGSFGVKSTIILNKSKIPSKYLILPLLFQNFSTRVAPTTNYSWFHQGQLGTQLKKMQTVPTGRLTSRIELHIACRNLVNVCIWNYTLNMIVGFIVQIGSTSSCLCWCACQ